MVLAKAGEMSVADASTLVANSLNTFHLKAKDAATIANELANAANISSADVSDLAESFKYVAPLAAKAGLSVGQVSGVLAELSNSGVKASQAGTSLRGMLLALQAPSMAGSNVLKDLGVKVYDTTGKMKPFAEVIGELHDKLGSLSDADRNNALKALFGKNAITGATILIQGGTKALDEYGKGIDKAGAAAALANAKSKGLAGTLAMIKAQTISSAQALYRQYSPAINDAILKVGALAAKLGAQVIPKIREFAAQIRSNLPAVERFFRRIADNLTPALISLRDAFKKDKGALDSFWQAVKTTTPQIAKLSDHVSELTGKTSQGRSGWARYVGFIGGQAVTYVTRWIGTARDALTALNSLISEAQAVGHAFSIMGGAIATAAGKVAAAAGRLPGQIRAAVGDLGSILYGAGQAAVSGLISGIESRVSGLVSALHHITSLIPLHKGPISKDRQLLRPSGQAIMDGLLAGIDDRKVPLTKALDAVTALIGKMGDKISNLKSTRAGFKSTFGADSIFGADLTQTTTDASGNDVTTPGTISDLLKFQKDQATHARALLHDVKAATRKGLSKSLVKQLQAQGASGEATLHLLANATPAQIALENRLNKQTSGSLQAAGMRAGNYVRGGSINADIARANRQERVLERLEQRLRDLDHSLKKDQTIVVEIDGEGIVTAIVRRNKRKGVKHAAGV
jgi:TP901 family phage tail tape measure protein